MSGVLGKQYIGDGVYVAFDGQRLTLTTEYGDGSPTNAIVLEPEVYAALLAFVKMLSLMGKENSGG